MEGSRGEGGEKREEGGERRVEGGERRVEGENPVWLKKTHIFH
jgi:hypothetical protein